MSTLDELAYYGGNGSEVIAGNKMIVTYEADGSEVIGRFGERAAEAARRWPKAQRKSTAPSLPTCWR